MKKKTPRISVIIPVLNGAQALQRTLDSISCQTYPHKEVIIIDGGSTDETLEIIKSNDAYIDCWISEPDRSIYEAFNKGLRQAKGDWLIFLGSGDYIWNAHALSDVATHLSEAYGKFSIVYCRVAFIDSDGKLDAIFGTPWAELSKSLATMWICHQGMFHHRSLFERVGVYDETFRIAGDYELLLRYVKSSEPIFVPEIIISAWQQGGISTDPRNSLKLAFERRRALEKNSLQPSWMSYVERVLYRAYKLLANKLDDHVVDLFLKYFAIFIAIDRKLRSY